jgi:O-antigen ligase
MNVERLRAVLRAGAFGLLVLSPLPFGSVEPWAVLAVEVAAFLLGSLALVAIALDPSLVSKPARLLFLPAVALVLLGIAQLLPARGAAESLVPNPTRDVREAVASVVPEVRGSSTAPTLARADTLDALLRLAAYVFVATAATVAIRTPAERRRAAIVIGCAATFQAVYGVAEYLSGHQHIFAYAKRHYLSEATGTFINRNHFASYLAMALPVAMGYALSARRRSRRSSGFADWLVSASRAEHAPKLVAGICLVLMWAGVLLSYSRGGLVVALAGSALLTYWAGQRKRAAWLFVATLALPLVALLWQNVRPPGERLVFVGSDVVGSGGRATVWRATVALVPEYPLLGSGYGTFEDVFASRQPPEISLRYDHAHNDWLECLLEGGPLAVAAFLAILVLTVAPAAASGRKRPLLELAPAAGVVAIALHSFVDFALRIPAVAVLAAVLVGMAASRDEAGDEQPLPFGTPPASR